MLSSYPHNVSPPPSLSLCLSPCPLPFFCCVPTALIMVAFVGSIPRVGAASLSATRGGSAFVCARPAPAVAAAPAKARWTMMPIGVPKVAYRVPGAPSADWVDIYNRLYRERIIFLGQEIDDEVGGEPMGGWRCCCGPGRRWLSGGRSERLRAVVGLAFTSRRAGLSCHPWVLTWPHRCCALCLLP